MMRGVIWKKGVQTRGYRCQDESCVSKKRNDEVTSNRIRNDLGDIA